MNRKILAALVAVIVVVLGVGFVALRRGGSGKHEGKPKPAPAKPDIWASAAAKPATSDDAPAPKGFAPRWQQDVDPEGPLRLEGQVVDADGHGVAGASVWLSSVPPKWATTEDDGSFAFEKLVGREYALTATSKDLVGGPVEYKLTETSDPVLLQLVPGSSVVVDVTDDAGKPIAGADVKLAEESLESAKTAGDGTATLKPVRAGWVAVEVNAQGYAPGHGFTQVAAGGSAGRLDVKLHKGFAVEGRVIDEHGKPISGARITTAGVWNLPRSSASVTSDAKGQFSIAALPSGSHVLQATDGEHAPGRSAPVTVAERPVSGVEIRMRDGGVLAGTVVDDMNKPVAYATVRVGGDGPRMFTVASRQATTDKVGHFEVHGLDRVKLKVRAEADAAASKVIDADLTTEPKKDVKLVLDVKGTIAGTVTDETGQAVAEVQVNAFPDILGGEAPEAISLAGMSSATTDGGGRFTIRGLPDGGYRVRASRASGGGAYEWGQQGVKAKTGDKNVKITLSAPGSIVGKVVVEGGEPAKLARVSIGYQAPVTVSADGTFKLAGVNVGKHDLRIHGANFAEFIQQDVEVKPGKPTDVGTITVTRGRRVTGIVVDSSGTPIAGAHVKVGDMLVTVQGAEEQMASFEEMYGGKSTDSDQDGKFTLVGIPKKQTNIMADHPARGRSQAIALPAGTDDPPAITLTLRSFGSISGKVTSQGKPAANVTVTDTPKGGGTQLQVAQTDADGNFTLSKVAEGTHVLSAMQQSGLGMSMKSTSATVQVVSGKEAKVTIDIPVGSITLAVSIKPLPNNQVDAAQVFLMHGIVAIKDANSINEAFLGGGVQGMKFWFGDGKPQPTFDELVPGDYSVCAIPITGDLNNPQFQQRIQEHKEQLKVYCKQVKVNPSPTTQTFAVEVPAMVPLSTN